MDKIGSGKSAGNCLGLNDWLIFCLLTVLNASPDNHHMGRSHGRSQTTVPLPLRYRQVSLSSGPVSQSTCATGYSWCSCSPQLQLWMWTGRATTHLPPVAQTCVFMSVNWGRTDPSRHSRDTQSVLHSRPPHGISLSVAV